MSSPKGVVLPTTKLPTYLDMLVVSDLHLNHPKLNTTLMVDRLIRTITIQHRPKVTKYLIIPGDIFDRPTQQDTLASKEISRFINFTLDFSIKHDLVFLVLMGTGSHDGAQSAHFQSANEGRLVKADLTYIDKISIFTDRYNVSWLGVPDEATPSAMQTQAEIESLMKSKGVSRVHMALTHGLYNTHNLNGIVDEHAHDTEWYSSIVDYMILNGHIHHPSQHGKLLTIGSHDRLRHGEEEAKGGWRVRVDTSKNIVSVEFFENKSAELFITYVIKGEDIKRAYREVDKFLIGHPLMKGGYLRLEYLDTLNINDLVRKLQEKYHPNIEFATKKVSTSEVDEELNDRVIEFEKIKTTPITESTSEALLLDKLTRMNVEQAMIDKVIGAFNKL